MQFSLIFATFSLLSSSFAALEENKLIHELSGPAAPQIHASKEFQSGSEPTSGPELILKSESHSHPADLSFFPQKHENMNGESRAFEKHFEHGQREQTPGESSDDTSFSDSRLILDTLGHENPILLQTETYSVIKSQVSELLETSLTLKMKIAVNPELLESELPGILRQYSKLSSEFHTLELEENKNREEILYQLHEIQVLLHMMHLNKSLREVKCGPQFEFVSPTTSDSGGLGQQDTKIKVVIDMLDSFIQKMAGWYEEKDSPRNFESDFDLATSSLLAEFGDLRIQAKDFLVSDTIISAIFKEQIEAVGTELRNIQLISRENEQSEDDFRLTENTQEDPFGSICFEELTILSEKEAWELAATESKLRSSYSMDLESFGEVDFEKCSEWRNFLNLAIDDSITQLARNHYPESCAKSHLKDLLKELTDEIVSKTDTALLLAADLATSGKFPNELSIEAYSELHNFIRGEVHYIESMLKQNTRKLQNIEDNARALGIEKAHVEFQVQEALFVQLSRRLHLSQWKNLPGSENIISLETETRTLVDKVRGLVS